MTTEKVVIPFLKQLFSVMRGFRFHALCDIHDMRATVARFGSIKLLVTVSHSGTKDLVAISTW
eukprot:8520394-Heterocapsa_arctica.AAC.1